MPYRLHATKRSLYKLAAEKIANLPWCELPKMSDVLFEHIRTSYWLRWPYHEVYFTTLIPGTPLLTVTITLRLTIPSISVIAGYLDLQ